LWPSKTILTSTIVGLIAIAAITALRLQAAEGVVDGLHVQEWSSDKMQQTLPSEDLQREPLKSLFYLHKQPPALDAVRAFLLLFYDGPPEERLLYLDSAMYVVWAVLYALLAIIVYLWLRHFLHPGIALGFTALWLAHPGPISIATLLEGSMLSALLTTWFLFELWRLKDGARRIPLGLTLAVVLLVYTRTVFQWYFIPVVGVALWLSRVQPKLILASILTITLLTGPLFLKQRVLFGTTSTSTFAGFHYCGLIWYRPTAAELAAENDTLNYHYPAGAIPLSEAYNNEKLVRDNLIYGAICKRRIFSHPSESFDGITRSVLQNASDLIRPTSDCVPNYAARLLPWREPYDWVFSRASLLFLFFGSLAVWAAFHRKQLGSVDFWRKNIPVALCFSYILAVVLSANRYGWVEAVRLKILLEPAVFVLVAWAVAVLVRRVHASWLRAPDDYEL